MREKGIDMQRRATGQFQTPGRCGEDTASVRGGQAPPAELPGCHKSRIPKYVLMYRTLCTTNSTNIMLMLVFYFVAVRIQDKPNAEPIRRDFIQYVFRRQSNRDCRIQTAKQSDGKNGLTKIFNKWFSEMILELFFFSYHRQLEIVSSCEQLPLPCLCALHCGGKYHAIQRAQKQMPSQCAHFILVLCSELARRRFTHVYKCKRCLLINAHW